MIRTILCAPVMLLAGLSHADEATPPRGKPALAAPDGGAKAPVLAEYRAMRGRIPDTAYAHHQQGLWCRENGLETDAVVQFRLQGEPERREARTQKKWLRDWEPRLRKWKTWATTRGYSERAETAMAGVSDPQAVPAI